MVQGKRTDIGLGSYQLVGLSEARDLARAHVREARAGNDPRIILRKQVEITPTFEGLAQEYFEQHKRREIMDAWAAYALSASGRDANVVAIKAAR